MIIHEKMMVHVMLLSLFFIAKYFIRFGLSYPISARFVKKFMDMNMKINT